MARKKKQPTPEEPVTETPVEQTPTEPAPEEPAVNPFEEKYLHEHDAHLRLAAEFDNYRKRTLKEKESAYQNGRADAVEKLLPVYDNLLRALQQETTDAAFKKGVEMTMNELVKILTGLGVEIFGEAGDIFDPNLHNAILHIDDDTIPENTVTQVFQRGFKLGDKVIRFAMVQVAN